MRVLHLVGLAASAVAVTIKVSPDNGKKASPLAYGLMFEDINHSGDGGIYAELIRNRAFQGDQFTPATLSPWEKQGSVTGVQLTKDTPKPLSPSLPYSVSVRATVDGLDEEVGISNPGYWGIDVLPQTYTGSFWVMGEYKGNFTAAFRDAANVNPVYASTKIQSRSVDGEWTKHEFTITPDAAHGHKCRFALTFVPEKPGQTLYFNLISLFPPTYKDRKNGMRKDLMKAIEDLNPSFLRFPGGNNLQGHWAGSRWRWNETLGDLEQRPGRTGAWTYFNTDGLGLIEYMLWCDDMKLEPILIVWAGLYLKGIVTPEEELGIFIQDALNQLEFLTGDASTEYGAKRAALGYPEPWKINFVGIGNEDHFSAGMDSYNKYRFRMFYDALRAAYPTVTLLASTVEIADPIPEDVVLDYHDYGNPNGAVRNFTLWDDEGTSRNHKVLVGEYGVARANGNEVLWKDHRERPWWIASVAEAVFWIGNERHPDKIYGSAFAPLLQHVDQYQWSPNLISFNANTSATTLSTSYHVIKLFSNARFTEVLPVDNSAEYNPAFWVAGRNADANKFLWKAAVYNVTGDADEVDFDVVFPGVVEGSSAQLTVLTSSDPLNENVLGAADVVVAETRNVTAGQNGFTFKLPQWSVALLDWSVVA
ncbi:hypothetical protein PpBr36_02628 [Pyricularia pennisetigena]|uniref:hypothetical protein n=1 Tax=Pyricularia pennisetigena TaxID=1578925 RepID=UPI001151DDD7|nr:hypothetical protein PpBr36_02628 [Pyricularia pennisetigena]TLS31002.1 hypothetical protein PpBr36_02628 [Pyricularia pennisetigena]